MAVNRYLLYFLIGAIFILTVGLIVKPLFFQPFISYTLLFACFVFFIFQPINDVRFLLGFCALSAGVFALNWIALKSGLVYGDFHYGYAFGKKLLGVPWIFALLQAVMISALTIVISGHIANKWLCAIVVSLLLVAIDLLIEAVAGGLNFWYFKAGRAGIHNYLGWFVMACAGSALLGPTVSKGDRQSSLIILGLFLFFFGLLFLAKNF